MPLSHLECCEALDRSTQAIVDCRCFFSHQFEPAAFTLLDNRLVALRVQEQAVCGACVVVCDSQAAGILQDMLACRPDLLAAQLRFMLLALGQQASGVAQGVCWPMPAIAGWHKCCAACAAASSDHAMPQRCCGFMGCAKCSPPCSMHNVMQLQPHHSNNVGISGVLCPHTGPILAHFICYASIPRAVVLGRALSALKGGVTPRDAFQIPIIRIQS